MVKRDYKTSRHLKLYLITCTFNIDIFISLVVRINPLTLNCAAGNCQNCQKIDVAIAVSAKKEKNL